MSNEIEHPALKNFSPIWESTKIIAGKALKWAAYGAVALGVLSTPIAAGGGIISNVLSFFNIADTSFGAAALSGALLKGGTLGGLFGAIKGAGTIAEELEDRKQDVIADYEMRQAMQQRDRLMKQSQVQNASNTGVSPGVGYGRGQQHSVGF